MTREAWEWGNPETVALRKEARTCRGCAHAGIVFDRRYCTKGKKYGKRCKAYVEIQITIQGK
jgi:hypothetical protein